MFLELRLLIFRCIVGQFFRKQTSGSNVTAQKRKSARFEHIDEVIMYPCFKLNYW